MAEILSMSLSCRMLRVQGYYIKIKESKYNTTDPKRVFCHFNNQTKEFYAKILRL